MFKMWKPIYLLVALVLLLSLAIFAPAQASPVKADSEPALGIDASSNEVGDKSPSHEEGAVTEGVQAVGDVIKSFASPGSGPLGLAWVEGYLWNVDWVTSMIYKLDPATGSVVQSFSSPGTRPFGLTYDGTYLWVAIRDGDRIYQLDPATGSVIRSIPSPGTNPEGLTWDGEHLWVAEWYDNKIYKIDPSDGSVVQSFNWAGGTYTAGLTWDGEYLWHCDPYADKIYKLDPATGSVITYFSAPGYFAGGLTWDGQYIWHSDAGADRIYQIDVGAAPAGTATASRDIAKQTLAPGGTTEVSVTFTSLLTTTSSFALGEDIPSGWTFTRGTDDAASFKPSTHEWVWFSVGAGATKTVTYSLTVPSDAAEGVYSISGIVTAAGVENTVGGETNITVSMLQSIATSPGEVSLKVGETKQLSITATYSNNSTADVTAEASYESSDTSVATVSDTGLITAVAAGSATITVTYTVGGVTKETAVPVTVTPADIKAYYRGYSGDPDIVDTEDLLKAADDWASEVIPSGFTESITTQELLQLADEWATG